MKEPTIKLNGKNVPCKDLVRIRLVKVSDQLFSEFTYRLFEPVYHEVVTLVPEGQRIPAGTEG